jgi:hypothetical protein
VSIDILDEDSLALAMRRLARDEALRAELGGRARAWWKRTHTLEQMAGDYRRVIPEALASPAPDLGRLPAHLRDDGTDLVRRIVRRVDGREDILPLD